MRQAMNYYCCRQLKSRAGGWWWCGWWRLACWSARWRPSAAPPPAGSTRSVTSTLPEQPSAGAELQQKSLFTGQHGSGSVSFRSVGNFSTTTFFPETYGHNLYYPSTSSCYFNRVCLYSFQNLKWLTLQDVNTCPLDYTGPLNPYG